MQLPEFSLDALEKWLDETFESDRKIVAHEGESGCLLSMYVLSNCPSIDTVSTGYGHLFYQADGYSTLRDVRFIDTDLNGIPPIFDDYLVKSGGHSITKGTAKKLIQRARAEHALVA